MLCFMLLATISIVHSFTLLPPNSTVCYGDLGCFDNNRPFHEMGLYEESKPENIQAEFSLYTMDHKNDEELLSYDNTESIRTSRFNKNLPLKVIVHGYANIKTSPWLNEMKEELFKSENINVLIVSWGKGAEYPDYQFAAVNSRIVGRELSLILNHIEKIFFPEDSNNFSIHCIGHSLGAHICGYAASKTNVFFDRITGLDPANEFFEKTYHTVRVDPRDAKFVDIIHTDIGEMKTGSNGHFGIIMETGTTDFYVNSGELQPGCEPAPSAPLDPSNPKGCSHNRAIKYFIESINTQCAFTSFKCESWEKYQNGECRTCDNQGCSILGYLSDNFRTLGSFYVATRDEAPYCGIQYLFKMKIDYLSPDTSGEIFLDLNQGKPVSDTWQISDPSKGLDFEIRKNQVIQKMFVSELDIAGTDINKIRFTKKKDGWGFFGKKYPNNFRYNKIEIELFDLKETHASCQDYSVRVESGTDKLINLEKDKICN